MSSLNVYNNNIVLVIRVCVTFSEPCRIKSWCRTKSYQLFSQFNSKLCNWSIQSVSGVCHSAAILMRTRLSP